MHHFLLFTIVLTAITFISLFWASAESSDSVEMSDQSDQTPARQSVSANHSNFYQRKADNSNTPSASTQTPSNNQYYVLGVG